MATRTAGLKVVLDGEKEYKQAIQDLNKGNQVLASEMRKLQEEYKGSEGSIEALNAKGELLQRQLLQQKDKVQTLREALQNAADKYGEADKRTQEWQIQLNNAEREQLRLEHAIQDTNDELKNQEESVKDDSKELGGLGDQIDGLVSKLGIHLPDAAKDALNGIDGFSAGTVAAMGAAAGAIALAYEAASALNDMTKEAAAKADELATRSARTGLSTDVLQKLDYAQRFLDFDGIDETLSKLTISMDKARDGAEKQAEAFEKLGIAVTDEDGLLLDNWETFKKVIDALGEIENAAERDAIAYDLFGNSYSELKPLIDADTDALQAYMDKAVENGYVMDTEQIQKLQEVDDAVQENEVKWESLKNKIAVEWAPAAIAAMDLVGDAAEKGANMLIDSGLLEGFEHLIESTEKLGDVSVDLFDFKMPNFLNPIEQLGSALDGLGYIIDGVTTALSWLEQTARSAWDALRDMPASDVDIDASYGYSGYGYNAAGTESWRGGLTWVGERGPELVDLPQGTRIYSNEESRQLTAAAPAANTEKLESLMQRSVTLLERISGEFSGLRIKGRMA